jgi:HPr kinase/phosphorylase
MTEQAAVQASATVHASAVLVGAHAVLIRGPSGSGKSSLAFSLVQASQGGSLRFARLVADDRVRLDACHGRLLARPAEMLAGLIEIRGLGIITLAYEPVALVGLVVDLAANDAERLPSAARRVVVVDGVHLPRLAIAAGDPALPAVLAALSTAGA